jgi:hypothetical protein
MPGGFPLGLEICNGQALVTAGSSIGIAITAGAANTKGSYTQLTAATANDACWIGVTIDGESGTATSLVDIAVGAAGSEKVIINNLVAQADFTDRAPSFFHFPCAIPAGTRIAARSQSATASAAAAVSVHLFDGAFTMIEGSGGVDSIGAVTTTSCGTQITASGSTNTKGAYVSLGITTRDYMGLCVGMDQENNTASTYSFLLDISIGASGSQKDIIPNLAGRFKMSDSNFAPSSWGPFFIPIPANTNLWARWQGTVASVKGDVTVYGIYQ